MIFSLEFINYFMSGEKSISDSDPSQIVLLFFGEMAPKIQIMILYSHRSGDIMRLFVALWEAIHYESEVVFHS